MAKHLKNVLRGMGSVLEIWPDPNRKIVCFYKPHQSPDEALYAYWASVGGYLISAMEAADREFKTADRR